MFQSCHECKKLVTDPTYQKDDMGQKLYWINPNLSKFTDIRLDFCGPICSNSWFLKRLAESCDHLPQETGLGTNPT